LKRSGKTSERDQARGKEEVLLDQLVEALRVILGGEKKEEAELGLVARGPLGERDGRERWWSAGEV
jgi:hypothetical protein